MFEWFAKLDAGVQLAIVGVFSTVVAGAIAIWREKVKPMESSPIAGLAVGPAYLAKQNFAEILERHTAALEAMNFEMRSITASAKELNETTKLKIESQLKTAEVGEKLGKAIIDLQKAIEDVETQMQITREVNRHNH